LFNTFVIEFQNYYYEVENESKHLVLSIIYQVIIYFNVYILTFYSINGAEEKEKQFGSFKNKFLSIYKSLPKGSTKPIVYPEVVEPEADDIELPVSPILVNTNIDGDESDNDFENSECCSLVDMHCMKTFN